MKVLQISRNLPIGNLGGNDILLQLFEQLRKKTNCEIDVVFPLEYIPKILPGKRAKKLSELGDTIQKDGYNISFSRYIRMPFLLQHYCAGIFVSRQIISKAKSADLIHAHYIFPDAILSYRLFKITETPYIITVRAGDIERLEKIIKYGLYYRQVCKVLNSASKILTMNVECSEYLKERFNINSALISHGVDDEVLDYNFDYDGKGEIRIVTCGEMIDRKRVSLVCQAVKELKLSGLKNITLDLIGDGDEYDSLYNKYNDIAKFHGRVPKEKVLRIFRDAHVFSLLSLKETFGMVYIEAAAQGNVIIGSVGTGVYNHFKQDEAFFVRTKDELKKVILDLSSNSELARQYATSAFNAIENRMTWTAICNKYEDIYHEVRKIE